MSLFSIALISALCVFLKSCLLLVNLPFLGFFFFFLRFDLVLERGEGREKERERNISWLPLIHALTGGQTCNPGTCPDWALNQRPFALREDTQPTEPHWSGLEFFNMGIDTIDSRSFYLM